MPTEQTAAVTGRPPDGELPAAATAPAPGSHRRGRRERDTPAQASRHSFVDLVSRGGVVVALVVVVAFFGIARPEAFLSLDNLTAILQQAAAPAILAIGLTVPLALGEFDLSIGSMVGLGGASAVALMSLHGLSWPAAVLIALLVGVLVGLVNGAFISYLGASSFVQTLAMGVILLGVEYLFTNQQTLYSGIPEGYTALGQSTGLGGVNIQIWFALVVAVLAWLFLDQTETGRRMYAVGGNPDAARFAGVSVKRLRVVGFIIVAVAATITGILVTAQGASSSPNAGVPYLLPAYAAAFLGSATFRPGTFNVPGTVVAVLFLGVIQTGLQMLQIPTAWINIIQGGVLVAAMLISRLERKRR